MKFEAGTNIAMKLPQLQSADTVHFYRDVLLLEVEEKPITHPTVLQTCTVKFGACTLWLDCVEGIDRSSIWLEIKTPEINNATDYLSTNNIATFDELEQIPADMHWIKDPAGTVLLLNGRK
jgi:hypothetical protein